MRLNEDKYRTTSSIYIIILWAAIMCLGFSQGMVESTFFLWGPNDHAVFAGMIINTWARYVGVVSFAFLSQCCESYVNSNLVPWTTNVIQDHKTKVIPMRWRTVMLIRTIHLLFEWMSSIAEILLLFTMQFQFYLFVMVGDMTIKLWRTAGYIKGKCMIGEYQQDNDLFEDPEEK